MRASPSRISAAGACIARAARGSAARPRSTASSMCAATRSISTAGRARARQAGAMRACCPISAAPKRRAEGGDAYRGDGRAAQDALRHARESALSRLHRGGARGGLWRDRGHQRLPAGGLRPHGHDGPSRHALERRASLSSSRHEASELDGADEGARDPHSLRRARRAVGVAYRRGGIEETVVARREVILAGGADQHAATLEALRHRARRRNCARTASRSCSDLPGVGENLPGPSRILLPGGLQGADHALFVHGPLGEGVDRLALAAAQGRARRDQSFRELRLHPQPRRRSLPRYPVSFPAARRLL